MATRQNIGQLLWDSYSARGDDPFIISGDATLSYREVGQRALRLAACLAAKAASGARLLIVSGTSTDYIVAYFAAHLAGQVTVEASPHESVSSLVDIARESGAWAIYTDVADLGAVIGLPEVEPDSWVADPPSGATVEQTLRARADTDLASIVYTSGTSGRPKGVMLSHGNFLSVSDAVIRYLELSADDRYLLTLPLYHTYGKNILLTTAQVGGSLVLFTDFARLPAFLQTLADQRVTVFGGVPFHYNLLLRRANLQAYDLSHWRKATVSGAPVDPDRISDFRQALPHVDLYIMYGLTESATRASYLPPVDLERKRGSVGVPIDGVTFSIRDEHDRAMPSGSQGEVCLTGPNVMSGYLHAPEATAEALRNGWLHTGDLGHIDADGYLFVTDRMKDLIKCAGERISSREVELVLLEHPDVVEAAVVGMPDVILGERVCAALVLRSTMEEDADIRQWCNQRLSHQRAPRDYCFLDKLPRTPSGKVKKHLLKDHFRDQSV